MPKERDPYTIHVVSHTHWDREWRYPFQATRARLVEMLDRLIGLLESKPAFPCFLLDSQCILLEDYLAIRPEKEARLRRLVREGRLQIGPWYTLPDTPELGGESIVRNLLLGLSITAAWEGRKWSGYTPCSFGQSSQMPQIFRGFGLDHIFFYRGNNDRVTRSEFIWEGPDGSRIMGMRSVNPYGRAHWYVHVYRPVVWNKWPMQWEYRWEENRLPFRPCGEEERDGDYRLLEGEPGDRLYAQNLPEALEAIRRDAVKGATSSHLLYMDGMDQTSPYPSTPQIIELANGLGTGDTYLHDSFLDYVQAVKEEARDLEVRRVSSAIPWWTGCGRTCTPGCSAPACT